MNRLDICSKSAEDIKARATKLDEENKKLHWFFNRKEISENKIRIDEMFKSLKIVLNNLEEDLSCLIEEGE